MTSDGKYSHFRSLTVGVCVWGGHVCLHQAHILCWFRRRQLPEDYRPIPAIPRTAPGNEPRQRPLASTVEPLTEFQHDHVCLWGSPCGIIPIGEFQGLRRVTGVCVRSTRAVPQIPRGLPSRPRGSNDSRAGPAGRLGRELGPLRLGPFADCRPRARRADSLALSAPLYAALLPERSSGMPVLLSERRWKGRRTSPGVMDTGWRACIDFT